MTRACFVSLSRCSSFSSQAARHRLRAGNDAGIGQAALRLGRVRRSALGARSPPLLCAAGVGGCAGAVDQYRAFCLMALGRQTDAVRAIEAVVRRRPVLRSQRGGRGAARGQRVPGCAAATGARRGAAAVPRGEERPTTEGLCDGRVKGSMRRCASAKRRIWQRPRCSRHCRTSACWRPASATSRARPPLPRRLHRSRRLTGPRRWLHHRRLPRQRRSTQRRTRASLRRSSSVSAAAMAGKLPVAFLPRGPAGDLEMVINERGSVDAAVIRQATTACTTRCCGRGEDLALQAGDEGQRAGEVHEDRAGDAAVGAAPTSCSSSGTRSSSATRPSSPCSWRRRGRPVAAGSRGRRPRRLPPRTLCRASACRPWCPRPWK